MKKRIFLKILLLGGAMIGLIGCGEKRGSRDWIENKVAEVSRVYPTENLFDLFKQFPDGFKVEQVYIKRGPYLIEMSLQGDSSNHTISGVLTKTRPFDGFLFQKLTINQSFLSSLSMKSKSYNGNNGAFDIDYSVQNQTINQYFHKNEREQATLGFGSSNRNDDYYYYSVTVNYDNVYSFRETVSN